MEAAAHACQVALSASRASMSGGITQAKAQAGAECKADSEQLSLDAASIRVQSHYRGYRSRKNSRMARSAARQSVAEAKVKGAFTTNEAELDTVDAAGLDSRMVAKGVGPITHMLLVLNESTFRGDAGDELFDEVAKARTNGVEVVLAHECDVQRGGCKFLLIFETTPQKLISDGLYDKIAIACHAEPYRQVSLSLIAKALGAESAKKGLLKRGEQRWKTWRAARARRKDAERQAVEERAEAAAQAKPTKEIDFSAV